MTPEEITAGEQQLADMNAENQALQRQLAKAEIEIAGAQQAILDAQVNLRSKVNTRDVLLAKRQLVKANYGELYEQVGRAKKVAEAAAIAAKQAEADKPAE